MPHIKVAVTSPSFSQNSALQEEIRRYFPEAKLNLEGVRLKGESLLEYVRGHEALIVGLEPVDVPLLDQCSSLQIIAKYGVGLNNIDLKACEERKIAIGWTGGVNRRSVSEMTLGFMIGLCRNLYPTSNLLKQGTWNKCGGFQLSGKTVGIIGAGHIGKDLAQLLKPFGCRILVNDIIDQSSYYREHGLIEAAKEQIYREADFITIHTPLTELTYRLINEKTIRLMKPTAIVINTARGGIIDEPALKQALLEGRLGGAALDTYEEEPPEDMEFLEIPNLINTPHIGGNAQEAVEAMGRSAIAHLKRFYRLM